MSAAVPVDPFGRLSALFGPALFRAASADGRAAEPVSFSLDLAGAAWTDACPPAAVEARVERATRTLVFVSGEIRKPDGGLLAVASAVFRVVGVDAPGA